jgi:hypothetical protein
VRSEGELRKETRERRTGAQAMQCNGMVMSGEGFYRSLW